MGASSVIVRLRLHQQQPGHLPRTAHQVAQSRESARLRPTAPKWAAGSTGTPIAMSFDIPLLRFRDGEAVAADPPLLREALGSALRKREHGYVLEATDGGHCSVQAGDLDGGEPCNCCMFFLRSHWTPGLLDLIFAAAKAGDMVLIPVMDPLRFILTAPEQREHLPATEDWAEPVLCASGEELGALMESGFEARQRYRDYVVHGQSQAPT